MTTTSFSNKPANGALPKPDSAEHHLQPTFELQNLTALPAQLIPLPEQPGPLKITHKGDTDRVWLFREGDSFILQVGGGDTPFKMPLDRVPRKSELPLAFATIQIRTEEGSSSHVTVYRRSGEKFVPVSQITFGQTDHGTLRGINPSTTQDHVNDVLHFLEGIQWGMLIGTAKNRDNLHIETQRDSSAQASDPGKDTHFATRMLPYALKNYRPRLPEGYRETIEFPYELGDPTANLMVDNPQLKITVTAPGMFGTKLFRNSLELHFDLNQRTARIITPKTGELGPLPLGRDPSLRSPSWHALGINHGLAATF